MQPIALTSPQLLLFEIPQGAVGALGQGAVTSPAVLDDARELRASASCTFVHCWQERLQMKLLRTHLTPPQSFVRDACQPWRGWQKPPLGVMFCCESAECYSTYISCDTAGSEVRSQPYGMRQGRQHYPHRAGPVPGSTPASGLGPGCASPSSY